MALQYILIHNFTHRLVFMPADLIYILMKTIISLLLFTSLMLSAKAQSKNKISIEANYGLNGNFFVTNYPENAPPPVINFYKKKFIGSASGVELKYHINSNSSINFGFSHSLNKNQVNYNNGLNTSIVDFNITHNNYFYQLAYQHSLSKEIKNFRWDVGLFYLRMRQQEIDASPSGTLFEERNFKNSKLEEGGVFIGLQFSKKIDTKLDLGIKGKFYYTVSTGSPEAIMLTPTLTYHF